MQDKEILIPRIVRSLYTTWEAIGMDVLQMMVESENKSFCTKAEVEEWVLDAHRLEAYGEDEEAIKAFRALDKQLRRTYLDMAFPHKTYTM
jgi:hypothetical protein